MNLFEKSLEIVGWFPSLRDAGLLDEEEEDDE